jgi:3'(2'), 5'-bisphosphate nucleotidase
LAQKRRRSASFHLSPANLIRRDSVVASKDHPGPLMGAMLNRLTSPQLQSMGSSLKFSLVVQGKADIYLRDLPAMEWESRQLNASLKPRMEVYFHWMDKPLHYGKPGLKNSAIVTVFDWLTLTF